MREPNWTAKLKALRDRFGEEYPDTSQMSQKEMEEWVYLHQQDFIQKVESTDNIVYQYFCVVEEAANNSKKRSNPRLRDTTPRRDIGYFVGGYKDAMSGDDGYVPVKDRMFNEAKPYAYSGDGYKRRKPRRWKKPDSEKKKPSNARPYNRFKTHKRFTGKRHIYALKQRRDARLKAEVRNKEKLAILRKKYTPDFPDIFNMTIEEMERYIVEHGWKPPKAPPEYYLIVSNECRHSYTYLLQRFITTYIMREDYANPDNKWKRRKPYKLHREPYSRKKIAQTADDIRRGKKKGTEP